MGTIPTAHDVIELLESYDLADKIVKSSEIVTANIVDNVINVGGGIVYSDGDMVKLTGLAPSPIQTNTIYFVIKITSTKIKLALTYDDAVNDVAIVLITAGTAPITLSKYDYLFLSTKWITDRMLKFVIPWVETAVRFPIGHTGQFTEYYSGQGRDLLFLNRRPVVSLDSIVYVLSSNFNWILTPDSIEVIKEQGILKARRSVEMTANTIPLFAKGNKNIKVTYTVGYQDMPDDLSEAIKYFTAEQALGLIASRTGGNNVGLQVSKSFGNRAMYTEIRNDLARWGHAVIDKYKSGTVGT